VWEYAKKKKSVRNNQERGDGSNPNGIAKSNGFVLRTPHIRLSCRISKVISYGFEQKKAEVRAGDEVSGRKE